MKIIFRAKNITAVLEYRYLPRKSDEKGTKATKKRKAPFIFENGISIFLARTDAII